eukprot:3709745-Pyramimonas_sp.AAC.1
MDLPRSPHGFLADLHQLGLLPPLRAWPTRSSPWPPSSSATSSTRPGNMYYMIFAQPSGSTAPRSKPESSKLNVTLDRAAANMNKPRNMKIFVKPYAASNKQSLSLEHKSLRSTSPTSRITSVSRTRVPLPDRRPEQHSTR